MATRFDSGGVVVYDGSTNPTEFIRQFKIQALYYEWDEAKQLANIELFLKGKAERVFTALNPKTAIKHVFDGLTLACSQSQELLLYQFYERKRGENESVSKYALALQDLLHLAVPNMDALVQNTFLRAQLCLSVPEHMKALIQFNATLSWDDLLSALDKSMPHVVAHANKSTYSRWDSQQPSALSLIKSEPVEANWSESNTSKRGSFNSQASRFNGTCNFCKAFGHKAMDCRKQQREQQNGTSNGSGRSNYAASNGGRPNYSHDYGSRPSYSSNTPSRSNFASSDSMRRPANNYSPKGNFSRADANQSECYEDPYERYDRSENGFQQVEQFDQGQMIRPHPPHASTQNDFTGGSQKHVSFNSNANSISATYGSNSVEDSEFPFFTANTNSSELFLATSPDASNILMKAQVELILFGHPPQVLKALIDGGSSHSFISSNVLSKEQLFIAGGRDTDVMKRLNFQITGATGVQC